jgi:hypothetical protein
MVSLLALGVMLCWSGVAFSQPPAGFVDASTFGGGFDPADATSALQAAIDSGSDVWVPNMGTDWIVNPIFLTQSNQTIRFDEGVVVVAKPGGFLGSHDVLFSNITRENVRLEGYGATFRMQQQDYLTPAYLPNEFRAAIGSYAPNGFEIVGVTIENAGGDGIYLGNTSGDASRNILVQDVVIDNAFRNGISIIAAKDVTIDNVVISSTSGHSPQAGIDFEPNNNLEGIENVVIRDSIIVGNFAQGIIWSLADTPLIPPVTGTVENVTVIGNGTYGLDLLKGGLPGWTIKDSLIVDNFGAGFSVGRDCHSPPMTYDCTSVQAIEHSAFWGNLGGVLDGQALLGTGSITDKQPIFVAEFVSTDLHHPHFMYLDPGTPLEITQGASDGSYMGARPVLWPEGTEPLDQYEWVPTGSGNWHAATSWVPAGVPGGSLADARLTTATAPATIVQVNSTATVHRLEINSGSSYRMIGTGRLELAGTGDRVGIVVTGGDHRVAIDVEADADATLSIAEGASLTFPAAFSFDGVTVTKDEQGALYVDSPADTSSGLLEVQGGTVGGEGTLNGDLLMSSGTLAPGHDVGQLAIAGDLALGGSAVLELDIGGLASEDFDFLSVDGTASLAGSLEVVLGNGYQPEPGTQFLVATASTMVDTGFALTGLNAGNFEIQISGTTLVLEATGGGLAGDYNKNGVVDAADYVIWRDTLGSTVDLRGDGDGNGVVTQADYLFWKVRFGNSTAGAATTAVPEPGTWLLVMLGLLITGYPRIFST